MGIEVALYEPLIPGNTGNIGRLCVGFNVHLHLIEPMGFEITDRSVKRAGLDYWPHLSWSKHRDFNIFYQSNFTNDDKKIICFTKFAKEELQNFFFPPNPMLLFGRETTGLPKQLIKDHSMIPIRIPVLGQIRSYNLANSVAIALFEAMRQIRWS